MAAETTRKFHFIQEIASGGFGSVYLAKVIHGDGFSRLAAIKLLHPKWSENEEVCSRMRDEARLLGQLRHRNIVDVSDLTMVDGRVAVIMEYLEAVDLRTIINDCIARGEVLPARVALEIAAVVSSVLDAAYNRPPIPGEKPLRVIHRDIKPSNVMIDESGTPKVLDFGVARADFEERESHTEEVAFGSVEYMPPERLFFEPETPAADVYSLGATLYELLALEKFGKAKLRPAQHEEMIYKRLRYLFGRHPVGQQEVRDDVKSLLSDMLAFDEGDRPSAADTADRMRAIARRVRDDDTLAEWAQANARRLLDVQHKQDANRPRDPLVDQVLQEDSKGFRRTPTDELFGDKTIPPDDEAGLDAPSPEDDRRWRALKEATLAEMAAPPVPMGVRSVTPGQAAVDAIHTGRPAPAREVGGPKGAPAPEREGPPDPKPAPATAAKVAKAASVAEPPPKPRKRRTGLLVAAVVLVLFGGFVLFGGLGTLVGVGVYTGAVSMPGPSSPSEIPAPIAPIAPIAPTESVAPSEVPGIAASTATTAAIPDPASAAPAPVPTPVAEPSTGSLVTPAPAGAPTGPSVRFVSRMSGTKKLSVRCDGGSAEGTDEVVLGLDGLGKCTVTGIGADRSRATAVIEEVRAGTYVCFASGGRTCEPEGPGEG